MPLPRVCRTALIAVSLIALAARRSTAQQLGTLSFPTSGSAAAQQRFVTGVLYLHSFEYEAALTEFKAAERLDPAFAMAYWGEAMTYTHPVWDQQDAAAARAALDRLAPTPAARLAKAPTPREQGFLRAVDILYGAGTKPARDTGYAVAMEELARRFPQDEEAQLFYALALLGLNQGNRDVPTYLKAGAIAETVFVHQPDHPGAVHYVIHSYDDPAHAAIALKAARAYSLIAPDAAHAQHMTSHIFLALGLWDDVVNANVSSLRVLRTPQNPTRGACGHYAEWLAYGYLQQGRRGDAAAVLAGCEATKKNEGSSATMRAAYIVDARDWSGAISITEPAATDSAARAINTFATGLAAAERGDREGAKRSLATLAALAGSGDATPENYEPLFRLELDALVKFTAGDSAAGLDAARRAARADDALPFPFGPPQTIKPPHELLGEMLFAAKRYDESRAEFELALARTPRRPAALLGLAQAEAALGHGKRAADTYAIVLEIWHAADGDLPGLATVRQGAAKGP